MKVLNNTFLSLNIKSTEILVIFTYSSKIDKIDKKTAKREKMVANWSNIYRNLNHDNSL